VGFTLESLEVNQWANGRRKTEKELLFCCPWERIVEEAEAGSGS
jgi:hypothetical protein